MEPGDIHLADLNEERRRSVLVTSNARFNRISDRVLIVPQILGPPDEVPFPWRIDVEGAVFAVDLLRSMPRRRLLERTGRAPSPAMLAIQRAIRQLL